MNYYFLIFEILMLTLLVICLVDASKRGWLQVAKIVAGVSFGLLLEWATLEQLNTYNYGRFVMMIAKEVPVAIGLGWGVIIYSASLFTDSIKIPAIYKPVLDALLAVNIDLAMDGVAIRLGMWDWGIPLTEQYFGVEWGNFWAWFWVVFFFSAAFRFFSERKANLWKILSPLLAVIIGTLGVLTTNYIITALVPFTWVPYIVGMVLLIALIVVLLQKPALSEKKQPLPVVLVPLVFHGYFLVTGLISGALLNPVFLLAVSLVMAGISLYLHRKSFSKRASD